MKLKRRATENTKTFVLALGALLVMSVRPAAQPPPEDLLPVRAGATVHLRREIPTMRGQALAGSNSVLIVNDDDVIVVDSCRSHPLPRERCSAK